MSLQIDLIADRMKQLGYKVRQSPNDPNCWYLSKVEYKYLFALIYESEKWRVRDISGNGSLEQPRIERELQAVCS